MVTLLLQCVAPLQSWGTQSEYIIRDTGREPSKSGIIGLLCAAMGVARSDAEMLEQLSKLTMGVRVDREGQILRDYHTVFENQVVSTRYYLADAMFLVGLEGDVSLLEQVQAALKRPKWFLFLGRKSCPPSRPPYLKNGLSQQPLHQAIREYPWLGQSQKEYDTLTQLRFIFDDWEGGNELYQDLPITFERNQRHFHPRRTSTTFISRPDLPKFNPTMSYPILKITQEALQ